MKDEVRKRVLFDLFASPLVLGPVVLGLTTTFFSLAVGAITSAVVGTMMALAGVGIFASRLVFGLEKITKNAYDQMVEQEESQQNKNLDELNDRLCQDKDPRPEKCLRELRSLRKLLKDGMKENRLGGEVLDDFENLFDGCVKNIRRTDDLWRQSRTLNGKSRKAVMDEREKIVSELEQATTQIITYVRDFNTVNVKKNTSEISDSLKELEQSITVARRTEERLANLDGKSYDVKEFE